jgi:hypothetical protein
MDSQTLNVKNENPSDRFGKMLYVSEPSPARHQNLVVSLILGYCGKSINIYAGK